ncbi:MAG TPA: protein kinase [Kofleriaceae bacterium]|nr:protein kinase [Kofleriaceae bacterium]
MSRGNDDSAVRRRAPMTPSGVTSVVVSRDSDEARIGMVIDGRYRLDALVGRGGMGVVYKAEHVAIRRTVALKLLHSSLAGVPELRSRFEREALAIGKIEHPNCVNVSDFGSLEDGSLYLVMEYLEGRSLGEVLEQEHHLRPRRALRILRHVLTGLGHAHASGIVHRDIKPDNVVLVPTGAEEVAKILDFGIAKVIGGDVREEDVKLTQAGVAFGTPVYMSPEQALGNPVDGRADLYAASVMAFEALTGRPPFFSDDKLEVMSMHTTRDVPSMRETLEEAGYPGASVPAPVEELVRRGLAKRPIDRWASAEAYIAALDEVLLDLALEAAPDTPVPEMVEPRTHTGHTGEHPLITTTGSSMIRGAIATAPSVPAEPLRSMPVELLNKKKKKPGASKMLFVFAGGAAVAVIAAVAIVWGTSGGDDEAAAPPATPIAARAKQQLDQGNTAGAIKMLEAQKDKIAKDASAQLVLGTAYAAKSDNAHAIEAYKRALALDPLVGKDDKLRANLRAISEDKSEPPTAMAAFEVSITTLHDDTARDRLIAMASGQDPKLRPAAEKEARSLGFAGQVDWLAAYSLDLDQGEQCMDRKEAVANLHALGDPRAIPALEKAVKKGKRNKCFLQEAQETMIYLRSLPGGHTP